MAAEGIDVKPLITAWRQASDEVKTDIGTMAVAAAERAAVRIAQAYPRRSGLLQSSVRTRPPRGWSVSEGAIVPARVVVAGAPNAPHIHFVEQGIAGRRRIAARPTFVPIVIEERNQFIRDAEALARRDKTVI